MILLLVPGLILGSTLLAWVVASRRPPGRRTKPFFVTLAAALAAGRLCCFWYLLARVWGGRESLDLVFIILPLYPEAALVPNDIVWTLPAALLFSAALVAGSLVLAGLITLLWRTFGGRT